LNERFEHQNAARMSAAGDGLTELHIFFFLIEENTNETRHLVAKKEISIVSSRHIKTERADALSVLIF